MTVFQCDEAWSPDFDRFELVSNRFGSSFLGRFRQKISDRKSIRKFGWMRTGKSSDSLGDWRWLALKYFKWVVLNGCLVHDGASSRGSDDGYVGTPQAALSRRKSSTIGVGRTDYIQFPLPPNRTGSSPAYGSPVSGVPLATDQGASPYQFGSPQGLVCSTSRSCFLSDDQRSGDRS